MNQKKEKKKAKKICDLKAVLDLTSKDLVLIGEREGAKFVIVRNRKKEGSDYSLYLTE